jgi:16S rRNA processing protein RimM
VAQDAGGRAEPAHLVVGHVAKAHGTRGELQVRPLTDRPTEVFAVGRTLSVGDAAGALDSAATAVVVAGARAFKQGLLVALEGIASREQADLLAGRYLLVPRSEVPAADDDELFYHELLGMRVVTVDGAAVGQVREVFETEPHHLLEVVGDDGRPRLIPFAQRIVREIDRAGARLVIDPPAGLLDL